MERPQGHTSSSQPGINRSGFHGGREFVVGVGAGLPGGKHYRAVAEKQYPHIEGLSQILTAGHPGTRCADIDGPLASTHALAPLTSHKARLWRGGPSFFGTEGLPCPLGQAHGASGL